MHNTELLLTILRRQESQHDQIEYVIRLLEQIRHADHAKHMRLACSLILDSQGVPHAMSDTSTTFTLTNLAQPSLATRYLGKVDVANGTTAPTITSSDTTKLAPVIDPAGVVNGGLVFGLYPTDAAAETNDSVTATISLAGQPDIVLTFVISGQPVPPPAPETDSLDSSGSVGLFAGAPALPATPV